ncbi:MAG: hypothetical protein KBG40_07720 [Bacteroidales bacterium]|nr:hypothetical protein [Bacteroidales bacterium]
MAAYTCNSFLGDSSEIKAVRRIKVRKELTPNYDGWKEPVILTFPSKNKSFQFDTFPEGGNLVTGIQNRLAFKAVKVDGSPLEVQGILFEDSIPLLSFKSFSCRNGQYDVYTFCRKTVFYKAF